MGSTAFLTPTLSYGKDALRLRMMKTKAKIPVTTKPITIVPIKHSNTFHT